MVITGRQRYENGWCFCSEINKLNRRWGALREEEEEEGGRRQKLSQEKGEGGKFSFMSASSHCFGKPLIYRKRR
ncbi:hypothetical protein LINPERPRIM_LOCUS21068, partial [Linum perenne]